jgi:hypothetical protein
MSTAQGYGGPLVARLADMPKQVVTVDADSTELLAR